MANSTDTNDRVRLLPYNPTAPQYIYVSCYLATVVSDGTIVSCRLERQLEGGLAVVFVGESIGEFLVARRKAAGWSQEELAERSTVSVRTIRNLETGSIRKPRSNSVDLLLKALRTAPRTDQEPDQAWPDRTNGRAGPYQQHVADGRAGQRCSRWLGPRSGPSPIVGRKADLDHVSDSVQRDRLVVLVGPGGVGKTRLALAAADRMRAQYRDGVVVLNVGAAFPHGASPRQDLERVHQAVLASIDIPAAQANHRTDPGHGRPLPADQQVLLVIDNAEHMIETVTYVCQRVLDDYDGLRLIVTSRRPMCAASAPTWEVEPLPIDSATDRPAAVELFLRLARSACPTLDLTNRLGDVAGLCAKLDGIPLAIELAALRLRSVSLDTLLRDESLLMLGRAEAVGLPHQRTLNSSVQWSYDLLNEDQRRLLHRLAKLSGSFMIEDIERLHCRDGVSAPDLFGQLSGLVDSSLVQVRRGPRYSYRLLGYVREFVNSLQAVEPGQHDP